jgi:nucleoside-diphosphate-sugar epimerase
VRILLTGSSGTIGTRLFETLLGKHEMVGVDIRQNKWKSELNGHTVIADLRRSEELAKLPTDFDMVIHFAANARVYELVKDPRLALDNIIMTFNVLEYMRKNNISRVMFASSREAYGNIMDSEAISEEMVRVENCESPYAASKISGEAMIQSYSRVYGVRFVILRFSNVYGMYDDSDRVVPLWIRQCMKGEDLTIYGRDKSLDFTYIDDTIEGVVKAIDRFDEVRGSIFNLSYGDEVSLLSVAKLLKQLLHSNNGTIMKGSRLGEVWKFEANISKAKSLLGYKPKIGIEEGLARTVKWYNGMIG